MTPLPIDTLLPQILASLSRNPNLVLEAAPGAGKTTRVPPALLPILKGQILVLEPRRIAARLAARRCAEELGEQAGETIGYQVRFEDVTSPRTRLRFVTEGILTRRLLSDPTLQGVDAVILDEFHERHLETDLALALLSRLQRTRPTLHLIVMSATLETAPVAAFLKAPTLRSEGRAFPLTIRHLPYTTEIPQAAAQLLAEGHHGHILAFLPGLAEIHRAARACEPLARTHGLLVLPLHGGLTPAEQDRVLAPTTQPKLILATNVAESSVTVPGVTAVIDTGLHRQATWSPWTGLPTLTVTRISQASAAQRAGRAGRTAPGQVLRLYPQQDLDQRPAHDTPEILRADLTQLALTLRATKLGAAGLDSETGKEAPPLPTHNTKLTTPDSQDRSSQLLDWLDPPPAPALARAEALLDALGATGTMAARLARYPLPPRLARLLIASLDANIGESGCQAAALLSSNAPAAGDLLPQLDATLDPAATQTLKQLLRLARPPKQTTYHDDTLLKAILTAFPDRVARRRAGREVLLANGITAELAGDPPSYDVLVALDAEDRTDKALPLVRTWCRCEPDWLLDLFPERLTEATTLTWNRTAERVEAVSTLRYDQLVLEESRTHNPEPQAAAAMLADKALEAGIARFTDAAALENLEARFSFAGFPPPEVAATLRSLAAGLRSFAELEAAAANLLPLLEQTAPRLRELAPATVKLPNGRTAKVHYAPGKPPWVSSRLQDFFGLAETPRIGPRQEPVVVHLLAPNQRAVQTTTDLAGFWQRLYPQVRKELMRRYPRHQWPEKP
jgi:ATP-dependent helicase HrpB